jgi:hypothetical protein
MANHMNVFEPYTSKAAHHEDALTRAFLLVLRGVPVAHAAWLGLVDRAHRAAGGMGVPWLHELGTPTVRTQTAKVEGQVKRVISLVQTDEVYFKDGDATVSERRQVLDGVVTYDQALAIVVENKPRCENIWAGQLDINVPAGVTLDKVAACVTWKDIVLAWGGLLEAGHLGSAEAVLLGDFLDYVEEHFSHLRPYSKVALCGRDQGRLHRRCKMVLQQVAGQDRVRHQARWGWCIRLDDGQSALLVGMFPRVRRGELVLEVEFDPGDTSAQARRLYDRCSFADVEALQTAGWWIRPNLHLAHMTLNLTRTHPTLPLADYWAFWADHKAWMRQWKRTEFDAAFEFFVASGLAVATDRKQFDDEFTSTKRQAFNLCPGLTMRWQKRLDEAAVLDQRGQLENEVQTAVEQAAKALKVKLPW